MDSGRGFSLWELVWTLALAAVVLALGTPALQRFILDLRRTADVNGFVTSVQLARSEAAKRRKVIVLCNTADRIICAGRGSGYEIGWMVFVNDDSDRPPVRDAGENLIFSYVPEIEGTVRSNRAYFEFRPFLRRSTNGTVTFCDRRGSAAARAVIVSFTGRPRTARRGSSGPLDCARLT